MTGRTRWRNWRKPARVEFLRTAARDDGRNSAGVFAEKIRTWMYGRDKAPDSHIVHHAAGGDFAPFLQQAIGIDLIS